MGVWLGPLRRDGGTGAASRALLFSLCLVACGGRTDPNGESEPIAALDGGLDGSTANSSNGANNGNNNGPLKLTSPEQAEGAHFAPMFTCAASNGTFGSGVNPELDWSGAPAGTQSFAITLIDTTVGADMVMGEYWAIWDIPPTVMQFPEATKVLTGALAGAQQTNLYLPPCPNGTHQYEFTVYALAEPTLATTSHTGSMTANSRGVLEALMALQMVTPLATATLHGFCDLDGQ
jgi:phosphatidylethanolamine-binding protein (PEBP) family uncharacterized protein